MSPNYPQNLQKQKIEIQFHPKLDKEVISAETDRLIAEAEEERRRAVEAAKLKREEEAKKEIVTSQVCVNASSVVAVVRSV